MIKISEGVADVRASRPRPLRSFVVAVCSANRRRPLFPAWMADPEDGRSPSAR